MTDDELTAIRKIYRRLEQFRLNAKARAENAFSSEEACRHWAECRAYGVASIDILFHFPDVDK